MIEKHMPQLEDHLRKGGKLHNARELEHEPPEQYFFMVYNKSIAIFNALERLSLSYHLIATFPNSKTSEKKGFTRDKWILYHLSFFTVTLTSLLDLCLLLTNEVFRLGMPERLCSLESITKNCWILPTDIPKALRALNKSLAEHQKRRNLHVHQGKVPDIAEILNDDLFDRLRMITLKERTNPNGINRSELSQSYRVTVKDLRARMVKDLNDVVETIHPILNSLLHKYSQCMSELRATQ